MNPHPIDPSTHYVTTTAHGLRVEHRDLGHRLGCTIERPDGLTWRGTGPLTGPAYDRTHDSLATAVAWATNTLDRLASANASGAAYRSRLRREAARGNQPHDQRNRELLDLCRDLAQQVANDEAFRADPDAYRRPTTVDYLDNLSHYEYTGDPTKAADRTWQQLKLEIEQAERDGKPDVASAFRRERDRRDFDNATRRARLGMPPAEPGLRYVELPSDSHVFDAIEAARRQDAP